MPKPTQLAPFNLKEQWLCSELPLDVQAPHAISKAEASPSAEKHFSHEPQSQHFGHYSKLMTVGEYWNADRLVK